MAKPNRSFFALAGLLALSLTQVSFLESLQHTQSISLSSETDDFGVKYRETSTSTAESTSFGARYNVDRSNAPAAFGARIEKQSYSQKYGSYQATDSSTDSAAASVDATATTAAPGGAVALTQTGAVISRSIEVTPAATKTLVLQGDLCGTSTALSGQQKDSSVEWNCDSCDTKSGSVTLTSATLNAVDIAKEVFAELNKKCQTPDADDMDYDSRLSACLEKRTKSSQASCLITQISKISFEKASDGKPYSSLSDFLDVLDDSLEPARGLLKDLSTSRDSEELRLAKDLSRKLQSAITKSGHAAKLYFQRNKKADSEDLRDATNQIKEINSDIKVYSEVASYKQSENDLFDTAKELNEKTQEVYASYSKLNDDSKKVASAFLQSYQSGLASGMSSSAYRLSQVMQAKITLQNLGPAGMQTALVIESWAKLLEQKQVQQSEAASLKREELDPLVKQITDADLKKTVNAGYNELAKVQNSIGSTDPTSQLNRETTTSPGVVTQPTVTLADIFLARSNATQGLAQQGNSQLLSTLTQPTPFSPIDVTPLFGGAPAGLGAERASTQQGRPGTPVGTPATAPAGSPAIPAPGSAVGASQS